MSGIPHISICLCTFKRPDLLGNLLRHLESQVTHEQFTYDVVIADNDPARSAEPTVTQFAATSQLRVTYCVEPEQNIALARNRTVANADGDLVAFIDDDEEPVAEWLYELFHARKRYEVEGVLGPVLPRFQGPTPAWLTKGSFYERPRHSTGHPMPWAEGRTGNVLITRSVFDRLAPPFQPQFDSGGEDVDFFRRAAGLGCRFVWCDEAIVHEAVPPYRCTLKFLARRAVLRGSNFPKQSGPRAKNVLKSVVAVPSYAAALPFLALAGHYLSVVYLVKLLEHASRLLAVAGVPLIRHRDT